MFLILIVCLMKLLEMTSNRMLMRHRAANGGRTNACGCQHGGCCAPLPDGGGGGIGGKENRAINGHLRNYFSATAAIKNGSKHTNRGMIDQFAGHQHHQKRHYQQQHTDDNHHDNGVQLCREVCPQKALQHKFHVAQESLGLTDSGLRNNVQIVLNNLHRNAFYADSTVAASLGTVAGARKRSYGRTMLSSPEPDCNSNPHPSGICGGGGVGAVGSLLSCSIASSHDFTHDNSDYQWFLDYGYRDGVTHQSILSSLSASYNGIGELSYYEDLAKNIDANLAEVDMESFTFRHADNSADRMAPLRAAVAAASRAQSRASSTHHDLDNSICTSKQLFSPVKETVTLSVDSLDLDGFGENEDIILTCQANKDNYTIAFEGSTVYSEESYYGGLGQQQQQQRLYGRIDDIIRQKALEVSMSRSDTGFTTWSKLKKSSGSQSHLLQRYPSGNNNTSSSSTHVAAVTRHAPHCFVRKSSSLPDLQAGASLAATRSPARHQRHDQLLQHEQPAQMLHVSQALSNSTVESYGSGGGVHKQLLLRHQHMLPMFAMPSSSADGGCSSGSESPAPLQRSTASSSGGPQHGDGAEGSSSGSDNPQQQQQQQPAFNLVKLFIKQKSSSTDTCMDVSSGCWPSSESPSSSQEQQQQQRHRKKSMNDSGKGSALSRHEEDMESGDFQYDSLDVAANAAGAPKSSRSNDLYREVFDSPSRAGAAAACAALNIKTAGGGAGKRLAANLNNNVNNNNNNSMEKDSLKETNTTSLTDDSRTSENITQVFAQANHIPAALMSRSIQTSMRLSQTTAGSGGPAPATRTSTDMGHRVRVVPPSFLAQLSQNSSKLGESQPAPVYVIYPNYALPDLAFVNHSDVILSPLSYTKSGMSPPCSLSDASTASAANARRSGATTGTSTSLHTLPKQQHGSMGAVHRRRPVSLLDCDALVRNKDYAHIADWHSLATLLPVEYRNLLRHIPAVSEAIQAAPSQRPLFSMSPPLRRSQALVTCDCAQFAVQQQQNSSDGSAYGSSGSDQRGSSGYRGSSTILLTDSEAAADQVAADPMRNMYVYQYENNTHMDQQQQQIDRPPSGRAQPRGILRRMNSKTRAKRNSMFEEPSSAAVGPAEKRHSLQEQPYYNEPNSIIEDYLAELDEHQHPTQHHRLNNSRVYTPTGNCSPTVAAVAVATDDPTSAKYNLNYIQELNEEQEAATHAQRTQHTATYYAEVANILHSIERTTELYDRHKLRSQVSRALSAQHGSAPQLTKKVSFDGTPMASAAATVVVPASPMDATITLPGGGDDPTATAVAAMHRLAAAGPPNVVAKEFSTPPNSPNISVAQLRLEQKHKRSADQEKQEKIQSNRFKRLQIQWELLSKEAQVLREELGDDETGLGGGNGEDDDCVKETRSGGSTPTSAATLRSRIPRPVSYPATKPSVSPSRQTVKQLQSPSRMVAPKRYSSAQSNASGGPNGVAAGTTTPSRSRTPSKLNTTPKRTVPTPTRTSSARSTR